MTQRFAARGLAVFGSLTFLSLTAFLGFGAAQENGVPEDFVIHQDINLVLLDTGVTDHSGAYVAGLPKTSFKVTENGKDVPITVFDSSDLPVTLGLIVDESGSMAARRLHVLAAAEALIKESNPRDEVFVLNFNDTVTRGLPEGLPFSSDIAQLRLALHRGVPEGRTAIYDAVIMGLRQLNDGRKGRKALVLVSDGGDTASENKRTAMLAELERSGATVYAIALFREGEKDADPGLLRKVTKLSGGEFFNPNSIDDLTAACRRIAKAIRSRYVIGYRPPAGKPGELRHVRVQARSESGAGLKVLARSSYRYREEGTASEAASH